MLISQSVLATLPNWLAALPIAIVVFLLFYLLAQLSKHLILRIAKRSHPNKAYVFNWLAQAATNTLIVIGVIVAAAAMGINVTALVTSLGLTGVTIGLIMKDSLTNTLAGAMVLIYPPFHLGDLIKVGDLEGEVYAINIRYTSLINQEKRILVPNIVFLTQAISITEAKEA